MKMTILRTYITLLILLSTQTSFGQRSTLRQIDSTLSHTFKALIQADDMVRFDSLAPLFKKQLSAELLKPENFDNPFDSLSQYVSIKTSTDKKIKFYSWDDYCGGTWHSLYCVAQFKTNKGKIGVQAISSGNEQELGSFTDSKVFKIHVFKIHKKTYYLTFAWGTHGSGHEHQIIQIFTIRNNQLVKCQSCFENQNDLVLEYPRGIQLNLNFDALKNELSYAEFKLGADSGFYEATGKTITLKLIRGQFKAQ